MAPVTPSILTQGGLELAWGVATHVGKARRLNEDSYLAEPGVFLVADGMGGHQAGDVASRLTVEAVRDLLSDEVPDISVIGDVVQRANDTVRLHAHESGHEGMGSTLVGAFLVRNADEDSVVIVNVGDSRCYALIDEVLHQVTKDHSHVQELVDSGEIAAETAATHPDRNVVTRAIGIEDLVAGDFFVVPPLRRVRLLLCSDGVSGELTDDRMAEVLIANEQPDSAAEGLIAAVLEGRAGDNATAIVIDMTRASLDPISPPGDVTGPRPSRDADASITGPRPVTPAFRPPELIADVPIVPSVHESTQVNDVIDDVPRGPAPTSAGSCREPGPCPAPNGLRSSRRPDQRRYRCRARSEPRSFPPSSLPRAHRYPCNRSTPARATPEPEEGHATAAAESR